MSSIGDACARAIWYSFRWTTATKHPPALLRLFERGKLEEARFVKWLKDADVAVYQEDPATGKQYRFSGYKGHVGGEMDGVGVVIGDAPYLLEFKTANDKSFKDMCLNKVEMSKPGYYVQMQMYMGAFGLRHALFMMINKNNDEIYDEVVLFDQKTFDKYRERAKMIVDSPEPPPRISNEPSWYLCKWCDHHPVCHVKAPPLQNCRTCAHSTPIEGGEWLCEAPLPRQYDIIPEYVLPVGCEFYHLHPTIA